MFECLLLFSLELAAATLLGCTITASCLRWFAGTLCLLFTIHDLQRLRRLQRMQRLQRLQRLKGPENDEDAPDLGAEDRPRSLLDSESVESSPETEASEASDASEVSEASEAGAGLGEARLAEGAEGGTWHLVQLECREEASWCAARSPALDVDNQI